MVFAFNLLWALDHLIGGNIIKFPSNLRKKMLERYLKKASLKENTLVQVKQVELDRISLNQILSISNNRPLVIKGLLKNTKAFQKWNLDYFATNYGEVQQSTIDSKDFFYYKEMNKITDVVNSIKSSNPELTLSFGNLVHQNAELIADLQPDTWLDKNSFKGVFNMTWLFFMTAKNKWTRTHSEFNSTLSLQIRGKKRWMMAGPGQSIIFDPSIERRMYINSGSVQRMEEILSLKQSLTIFDVILEEGDVLYCPPFYWHFVDCLETSISVGYKWSSPKTIVRNPFLSFIILTARNPSLFDKLLKRSNAKDFQPPRG